VAFGTQTAYEFGVFRLLAEECILLRDGHPLHLTPKVFETLLALVENNGQLVLKDTLIKRVWPDTFVHDENLTYNISVLRKTLRDGMTGQEYIETVPRRGYRFIAPVKKVEGNGDPRLSIGRAGAADNATPGADGSCGVTKGPALDEPHLLTTTASTGAEVLPSTEQSQQGTHQPEPGGGAHYQNPAEAIDDFTNVPPLVKGRASPRLLQLLLRRSRFAYAIAGLALVVPLLAYQFVRPLPVPILHGYEAITFDGREKRPPLLTDGRKLYFEEKIDGRWMLAITPVTGGNPSTYALPSSEVAFSDIAPDGSNLVGWEALPAGERDRLLLWPTPTGPPELLGDLEGRSPSWSPDGSMIVYSDGIHSLLVAGRHGENPRKVASVEGRPGEPHWSPDGKTIRFRQYDPRTEAVSLWEVSLLGGYPRLVLNGWKSDVLDISSWTPDRSYTFFVSRGAGLYDFGIWARREDCNPLRWHCHDPVQIASGLGDYYAPLPSRDGNKLFVMRGGSRTELARYDLRSGTFARCLPGVPAGETDFSPDRKWVAYVRMPEHTLWRSRLDGSDTMPMSLPGAEVYSPHWSPDSKQIAHMDIIREGQRKIYKAYVTPAAGGKARQLVSGTSEEGAPTWSPDGQRLAFGDVLHVQDATKMAIHLVEPIGSRVSTLPGSSGLWNPRWSPDGRYIAALALGDISKVALGVSSEMSLYDFRTSRWSTLVQMYDIQDLAWSPDSVYVYFRTGRPDRKLRRVQIAKRRIESLAEMGEDPLGQHWLGMAPDGSPLVTRGTVIHEIDAMEMDWR
jgi:Tol biopolymer transport system component/DNA-binding winged helix-turn-helix (wHTH) protein